MSWREVTTESLDRESILYFECKYQAHFRDSSLVLILPGITRVIPIIITCLSWDNLFFASDEVVVDSGCSPSDGAYIRKNTYSLYF